MHVPPDPSGTPPPTGAPAGPDETSGKPASDSTGSHRTTPKSDSSLSDLIRKGTGSSSKSPNMADIAQMLSHPGSSPIISQIMAENTDDSPTVITNNAISSGKAPTPPLPPPPYVVGEIPSLAGRRLGHFELIEAVGAGGMAAVLKARDLELGRIVALKILPPEAALDPENVARFKSEARAAAKLDHDNVARVYFCGEDQNLHFIAFEFVEGITLRQMIDRRGTVPVGECIRYMIQVAAGLAHAAERHVVHRDIKPSNIIITPEGRAKIVDMGLARHMDAISVNGGVTQSGVTLGTFDYISPEQALDPRQADVRSDIYSLGCSFYHALTGRPPVPEGTAAKKLHSHQHVDPLDPRELNKNIPDDVAYVLARMMAKDTSRRYQTPAELIAQLKGVAERLKIAVDSAVSDSVVKAVAAEPGLPRVPRVPLGWVAAAIGVAVAVVALILSSNDNGPLTSNAPNRTPRNPSKTTEPGKTLPVPPGPGVLPDHPDTIRTAKELAEVLAKPETQVVRLAPGVKYDLTKLGVKIAFAGKQLDMIGSPELPPRVIVPAGGLSLKAETVTISGVRFDVVEGPDAEILGIPGLAGADHGLLIADAAQVILTDCIFDPNERVGRKVATVAVNRTLDGPTEIAVNVTRCLFAPGSVGLRVPPRVKATIDDCGFGPHDSAILVAADNIFGRVASRAEIKLEHSSFMIDPGKAAIGAEGAGVNVSVGYCVFAPANGMASGSFTQGMVIRGDSPEPEYISFTAIAVERNAYYHVEPIGSRTRTFSFEECQSLHIIAEDKDRAALGQRPWDAPGDGVLAPFDGDVPFRAFRLRTNDSALFVPENNADYEKVRLLGAQFHRSNNWLAYDAWPPTRPKRSSAEEREKVWHADARGIDESSLPPGHSTSLVKLLEDARSGDVIRIQANGEVRIKKAIDVQVSTRPGVDRNTFKLTFKPAEGFHPVIAFDADNRQLDAAMFRVIDGEITFENLHFLVKPRLPKKVEQRHDSVTAVKVIGSRGCVFTHCLFDLDEDDGKAAAVALMEPGGEMMMEPAGGRIGPSVAFAECMIRGRGRGVWVTSSRAFDARMDNSVAALYGPVLQVKESVKGKNGTARSSLKLTRTTAALGGPLVELHAGQTPVDVEAGGCLFAAVPFAGKPLAELDGVDPAEVKRDDTSPFRWKATRGNRYANYDPSSPAMVMHTTGGDGDKTMSWSDWPDFADEPPNRGPVGKVTFKGAPANPRDLATVLPHDLDVKAFEFSDLTTQTELDAGADLKKVARPRDEEE